MPGRKICHWLAFLGLGALASPLNASAAALSPVEERAEKLEREILEFRGEPMRTLAVRERLSVADFGAPADGAGNALPAILAAIEAARRLVDEGRGPVEVFLPPGRYALDTTDNTRGALIRLESVRDLVLNGNGSEILIRNPFKGFIHLHDSANILVRDFVIDYDPLLHTEGVVRSIDPGQGSFDWEVLPGFPQPDAAHFLSTNTGVGASWGMLKDGAVPGRMKFGAPSFFPTVSWQKLPNGNFRFQLRNRRQIEHFALGDRYLQLARQNGSSLAAVYRSERITFRGIVNFAAPAANYLLSDSSEVVILDCHVLIKEGRWHSSNADGVLSHSNRLGPWIEGCTFEGIGDDGTNLHGRAMRVVGQPSARELVLRDWTAHRIQPGHRLLAYDTVRGKILATARVVATDGAPERRPVAVTVARDLPDFDRESVQIYNHDVASTHFVIRNNQFRNYRRYGHLMTSNRGIIAGNTYEGVSDEVFAIYNYVGGHTAGLFSDDLVIRDNVIRDSAFNRPIAAVRFQSGEREGNPAAMPHTNIYFLRNAIHNWSAPVFSLRNVSNFFMEGNRIVADSADPRFPSGAPILEVGTSQGIHFLNNQVQPGPAFGSWLEKTDEAVGRIEVGGNQGIPGG